MGSHTWKLLGATHSKVDTKYKKIISKLPRMLRRRSSNVYCSHNGVLCREEDLTLSAVCSTCAQAHLAQVQLDQDLLTNSTKDEVDSSSSTTSSSSSSMSSSITSTFSKKSKSKRTVTFMPLLPDDAHQAEVAEE